MFYCPFRSWVKRHLESFGYCLYLCPVFGWIELHIPNRQANVTNNKMRNSASTPRLSDASWLWTRHVVISFIFAANTFYQELLNAEANSYLKRLLIACWSGIITKLILWLAIVQNQWMKILLQQIFDVEVKAGKTLRVPKYHIFLILIKNQTKKPIFTPLLNIYFYFSNINKLFPILASIGLQP